MQGDLVSFDENGSPRLILDTAGDVQKAREFINELEETGRLMTEESSKLLVKKFEEAVRSCPPEHTVMVDSVGHLITGEQAEQIIGLGHFIPKPKTLKQKRAEKAAKKREAKYKRSQHYREMGML
jgi:hypothetical protein